jgi:hypothetical protein
MILGRPCCPGRGRCTLGILWEMELQQRLGTAAPTLATGNTCFEIAAGALEEAALCWRLLESEHVGSARLEHLHLE